MPSLPQPLSRAPPSDAWAFSSRCWTLTINTWTHPVLEGQLRRPCVFSGIRSSPAVAFLVPSMDSPMWDLGPRLSLESVTDSAQAVEPTHLSLTCCSGSSHVSVCGSYVCVCALTHSPWNRVLTPLFKFAHMSSWISSLVPRPGCTRSLGSSAWVCVPSLAQHHVASTVLRHFLCMLSCRYHGCPSQLLPLCLFMCVVSHPV